MKTLMKKKSYIKLLIGAFLGTVTTLIALYLLIAFYYNSHFIINTNINGVNVSNMTSDHVEAAINSQVKSYVLTLKERNNKTEQIKGKDIDLHAVFDGSIKELLSQQNSLAWPISIFKSRNLVLKTMLEYENSLLKQQVNQLNCFDKENAVSPVSAHVSEYGKNGFKIEPEENGAKVNDNKLLKVIQKNINSLEPKLNVEKAKCYEVPTIKSDNAKLIKAVKKMNKIASSRITYEFGDKTEVVDGQKISKWLYLDDKLNVILNPDGIKEFVDYIGKNYNSFGRIRTFKTSYDKEIKIKGGDYGWWLNRGKEKNELTKLLLNGQQLVRKPAYFQTAKHYGSDDIGDTYVEINLTAQHLFFYKDGSLVLESDFVSGNVSLKRGTPVGTYPIQYKENDATLVGEDYSTPVKYWMPFNGNIGLHDANWRDEFGKDIYLTRGSHGCINMPPANAKKIFENISKGVAVVVYELPGTENIDNKDKTDKNVTKKG